MGLRFAESRPDSLHPVNDPIDGISVTSALCTACLVLAAAFPHAKQAKEKSGKDKFRDEDGEGC